MKDQRKTEIKVGMTSIAGIIIFLWILGWAKNFSFTSSERTLYVKFNDVAGLEVGDYVTVNGVNEGNVSDISAKDNSVLVKLSLDNGVQLNKDAKFGISMLDLMGGKKVTISPGNSKQPLDFSKVQTGTFYADIPSVMSMLGSFQGEMQKTIKEVNITLTSLNSYLTDKKLNNKIKTSIYNMSDIVNKLNIMIDENRSSIKKMAKNSADLTEDAKTFIAENKADINKSVKNLSSILQKTDTLISRINDFTKETKEKKNSLGKALYNKELFTNINDSIKQLNELTKLLIKQLNGKGLKVKADVDIF